MHIGLVSDQYPPYPIGGVGARVTELARGLAGEGHKVTVIGVYPRNRGITRLVDESIDGVRVVRLPPPPPWMRWRPGLVWERYSVSAHLKRLNKEFPFDLVEFTDGFGWALFGAPRGVPTTVRLEGAIRLYDQAMGVDGDQFSYWMEKKALQRADFLAAVSHYAKREILALFGLDKRECEVIHNGVDVEVFSPGNNPAEEGLIVFANSIEPRKGAHEMVAAMNDICAAHPRAHLAMIGSDTQQRVNGRSYSERALDAVKPEFRDRIQFTGRLDRTPGVLEYLRKAALCCYPSRIETFGIAPLEAMAVGKPVIYYDGGPGSELIEDGVSGFLCDCRSPHAIAEKANLILANPEMAAAVGRHARERVAATLNKSAWIRQNVDYFRGCIESYRARRKTAG